MQMITENIVTKLAGMTAAGTLAGTMELTQNTDVDMSIVLWIVGGLLAVIALLLAAISYFIRDMRNLNARQHVEFSEQQHNLSERLSNLEGQHASAVHARGCAYDSKRLERQIKKVLEETEDD